MRSELLVFGHGFAVADQVQDLVRNALSEVVQLRVGHEREVEFLGIVDGFTE